ncbi:MAG: HlyC/CorC family transporter [Chlamydiae bacterium CG10_big_fil_rev_8_21_14_0_10_42_34]|nr:MAG: HlyC/CorC family transporter [Chlamydiae bacterium CG10_big_fil_rev_8_21_14_0_10_42_34]
MNKFLFLTLLSVAIQALFAFFEMACVSFNRVRLQYYVSIGTKRAIWLNYLLMRPSRLFGTTLVGITTSLMFGSECSRHFYESMNLDPDWAPLTQVPLVVIFGELAPMFAARRHPEQSAMVCVPLMIFIAKILTPITWTFDAMSHFVHRLMGKKKEVPLFLSREEVKMAFEEQDEGKDEFNAAVGQIFQLKNLTAGQLMIPLAKVQMVPSHSTLSEVRHLLSVHYSPMIPIYHRFPHNIVAIAQLRELLPVEETKRVIDSARSPWFVTRDTSVLQLLQQFRRNNQSVAVILDPSGQAAGVLTLDQILSGIFGEKIYESDTTPMSNYIDRTLSGDMSVSEFNKQFDRKLPEGEGDTLSDLIMKEFGYLPVRGESIHIDDLEFTADDLTLLGIKTLSVHSFSE